MKKETLRLEAKQSRQLAELRSKNEAIISELDQVYVSCHAHVHCTDALSPQLDNIRVMVIVWRLRGNIIRTALCWIV